MLQLQAALEMWAGRAPQAAGTSALEHIGAPAQVTARGCRLLAALLLLLVLSGYPGMLVNAYDGFK